MGASWQRLNLNIMSIILNNGVQNIKGTPGIIQDSLVNLPAATSTANGTIFIDTVSLNILINISGIWTLLYSSGATPNLQQVLDSGNSSSTSIYLNGPALLQIGSSGYDSIYITDTQLLQSQYSSSFLYEVGFVKVSTNDSNGLFFRNNITSKNALITQKDDGSSLIDQIIYIPENNGTIALQDTPFTTSITSTPFTPSGAKNSIYRIATGAVSIVLNPTSWTDRKTVTFCCEILGTTFSANGGATIVGGVTGKIGLFYITYIASLNKFYTSLL